MEIKDTVFNVSAIHKRLPKSVSRHSLHYFANGMYNMLSASEIKKMKDVIDYDYKIATEILNKSLKTK